MAQCGFLDLIQKVLIYDLVISSFIVLHILSIIFKQLEWTYQSKNIKRKAALHSGKETNRHNKETSLHRKQPLHNANTNVTSHSAMNGSLTEYILERSTSPKNVPKTSAEDLASAKTAAFNVKRKNITASKHFGSNFPIYLSIDDDNGDLKLDEINIIVKHQFSNLQDVEQLLKPLFSTSATANSCKPLRCVEMNPMQGLGHQALMSYTNRPSINISKLRMHFLRKVLEKLMMAYPPIVQRSVQMYTEDYQITPEKKSDSKELSQLKSDIPVPNVAPPHLDFDNDSLTVNDKIKSKKTPTTVGYSFDNLRKIQSPIGHRSYCKRRAPIMNFNRSKRHSVKETELPIGTLLRLGKKVVQYISPEVCLDKSPKPNQIHNVEFGNMGGTKFGRSKFPTTNKKNKMVVQENRGNVIPRPRGPPHVTHHIKNNHQQEPHLLSYSKCDQDVPTPKVRLVPYSCSDTNTTVSAFRFSEVFATVKRFFVKTAVPSPQRQPQRGQWRGETIRKGPYKGTFHNKNI